MLLISLIFPFYVPQNNGKLYAVGKEEQPLPYLLYLQGGPGFECPRPTKSSGWIGKACEEFRVILMDQARLCDFLLVYLSFIMKYNIIHYLVLIN